MEVGVGELFKLLIGFFKVFATLVVFGLIFFAFSGFLGFAKCDNESDWKQLKNTLIEAESSSFKTTSPLPFQNAGCYLAGFSQTQPQQIFPDKRFPVTERPMLCLCQNKDKQEASCNAFDCFKFKSYDAVESNNSREQFQTIKDKQLVFLTFIKNEKTLKILKLNEQKNYEETLTYKYNEDYAKKIDTNNLINSLDITTTDATVFNFVPYVKEYNAGLKPTDAVSIPSSQNTKFPIFFDIELADVKEEINSENLRISDEKDKIKFLDTSKISKSRFVLNINYSQYETLLESEKNSLQLYYKKGDVWLSKDLACSKEEDYAVCSASIPTFVNNYAISIAQKETTEEGKTDLQSKYEATSYDNLKINTDYFGSMDKNTRNRKNPINTIVLHHTGPAANAKAAVNGMISRQDPVSIHYIIDRNGQIYQIEPDTKVTYHAGCLQSDSSCKISGMNEISIGIEIINSGSIDDKFDGIYPNLKLLLEGITKKYSIPYDNNHIIAHYQITSEKYDPSPNFDWSKIGLPQHITYFVMYPNSCPKEWGGSCSQNQYASTGLSNDVSGG